MKAKRFLAAVLCLVMVFSFTACSGSDYKSALAKTESGDWAGARDIFSALGSYKDAAAKVTECDYQIAGGYMADGKYDDAVKLYESLGGYLDSADLITKCNYQKAEALLKSGAYDDAIAVFESLGSYQDSADKITECKYQKADGMMQSGAFDDAIAVFEALGSYQDSADRITECKYQKALGLLDEADYEGAEELFTALGDYQDSAEKIETCRYQHAVSLYDEGNYGEALDLFMTVPTYESADHYCVLCYLQSDPDGFVDIFVDGMNMMYAAGELSLTLEEEIVPYERDARSFYADNVPDLHEILLCFNCNDAKGSSHADGQINNITVIGDTYDVNDFENIYAEFLYTAIFATCVLDDASMLDPETPSQMIADSFTKIIEGFNGKDDYNESESFDYNGYECDCAVIFWPGADGIYRFIYSITIPELVME